MTQDFEKDMTVYDLAILMMRRFDGVDKDLLEIKGSLDALDHRTITLKKVIQEDLHTQVRW